MNSMYTVLLITSAALIRPVYTITPETSLQTNLPDTLSLNSIYKYRDFLSGVLTFKDGKSAASRFNINMLVDEIQFINLTGDTLSLADVQLVDNIVMGGHLYYFKKGAIEVIRQYKPVRLGINQKMTMKANDQEGDNGVFFGTRSVARVGTYITNGMTVHFEKRPDLPLSTTTAYYFINQDESLILPATKNNLYKVFREQDEKALSQFVADNKINFKREEDLCKLLAFSEKLVEKK